MSVTNVEVTSIVENLQKTYGNRLMELALFDRLTAGLIHDHTQSQAAGRNSQAMRGVLKACIGAYLRENDFDPKDYQATQDALDRANTTVLMLDALPA